MKVALFGATGKTGRETLREALARGHTVTALVRDPAALPPSERLVVVQGNALDPAAVAEVVQGQDAVLQCLGVGGKGDGSVNTFVSESTTLIVGAMQASGVRRLVCMSNVGAGDSLLQLPWFFRKLILPVFMRWLQAIIDDKDRMEPVVMASDLDWTLARFPGINDGAATGKIRVSADGKGVGYSIRTADAAMFLVRELEANAHLRQAVSVSG